MTQATVRVAHIGEDYATINLFIQTPKGSTKVRDIEVARFIGEALDEAGLTDDA